MDQRTFAEKREDRAYVLMVVAIFTGFAAVLGVLVGTVCLHFDYLERGIATLGTGGPFLVLTSYLYHSWNGYRKDNHELALRRLDGKASGSLTPLSVR